MKVDFSRLKTDISLPDFLLEIGWKFAPGTSNSSPKMTDGDQTIVIKKNSIGQYTYWDVHDPSVRGKTIIDLTQKYLYETTGQPHDLRKTGEFLQRYLNDNKMVMPENSKFAVSSAKLDEGQSLALIRQLKSYSGDFLGKRGINEETLSSPAFSDVFFTKTHKHEGIVYNNTCVKLVDKDGRIQGLSQRGTGKDDQSFKGMIGSKFDSIAVSRFDRNRPIDHAYIGESMIDNASHYQMKNLNSPLNLVYISTEGNMTEGQMELIKQFLDYWNIKENHSTIFDNDRAGYIYTLNLDNFLKGNPLQKIEKTTPTEELKEQVVQLPNAELPLHNDWNEDLQKSLLKNQEQEFSM